MKVLQKGLFLGLSVLALSAHAALFDDTVARKKILDLEAKTQTNHESQAAEIEDLKRRLSIQTQGLLDMQNEIELLRQEVAQSRGGLEVVNHALETTEQRQKDLYADTDARIRKLENGGELSSTGETSSLPAVDEAEDVQAYKVAYAFSQQAKHQEAFESFNGFIKAHPDSKLMPDALYGLGYSQFALKSYKSSITTQKKLLGTYPNNSKVPNAMYSIANSQIQLGQVKGAKKTLRNLISNHPDADVVPNAKKRLKILETIK